MSLVHPSLPGDLAPPGTADQVDAWPVVDSIEHFTGPYLSMRVDTIAGPDGAHHPRAVVQPRGAVGVLAVDDGGRVLLIEQFRHPVGRRLLELPAGIMDVEGESARAGAARELAEEADLVADTWEPLIVTRASPGYSTEVLEVFRASDLRPVPVAERTPRSAEEAGIRSWWFTLDEAVTAVLDARITNGLAVAAVLAEYARRHR